MSKKALEDTKYELIKAHILDPENSPLSYEHQQILDRVISVSKILDKNPIQKQAVALHMAKYPHISKTQAYEDLRYAMRVFNSLHTFDYDFWQTWLLQDICENIKNCRNSRTPNDRRIIAMEHANLIKAIGTRPEEIVDPTRNEKHNFYIVIQNNNQNIKIDASKLSDLQPAVLGELNKALFAGKVQTDDEIMEEFNS